MRLWNDYEGTTIADAYPIEKLIRPEGRSAFFSTSNGTGTPAVLRLIESIHDEVEILNRWQTVADLKETHLVTLKKFGQTVFEGTSLIYVLMESTEADLASILQQGTLSVEDTRQLATSLIEAVGALHASGIVHEHIEPINVLAKGDVVKLRSDCIRETPEGAEGIALMKQDVHDIAVVLLQALTQRKSLEALGSTRLPAPFDAIIRNGMNGTWGLAQIASALNPPAAKDVAAAIPMPKPEAAAPTTSKVAPTTSKQMPLDLPEPMAPVQQASTPRRVNEPLPWKRSTLPVVNERDGRKRWWVAVAPAAVILLAAVGWHELHKPASAPTPPVTTLSNPGASAAPEGTAPAGAPSFASPVTRPTYAPVPMVAANGDTARWRVIAYTYNHQDQAQHKVNEVAQKDPSLHPEVFSPHGGAPYLVALGGSMTRGEAAALRAKAAGEGLPRDTYIQNYEERRTRRRRR